MIYSLSLAQNYEIALKVLFYILVGTIIFFIIFGIPLFIFIANSFKKVKVLPKGKIKYKYAVMIPARNESKVIANSLNSLKNQDYDKDFFDVFVIVEDINDPTVEIVKSMGYNYVVRKDLENKRTKGWALDECVKYIWTLDKKYDAFIVFDADNILEQSYISKLNDIKNQGYDMGVGDRLFTNCENSYVAACSATLFSYISKVTCYGRSRYFHKLNLIGAGYFINSQVVEDAGGWIWNSLTEDAELTNYGIYHNLNCMYYPLAKYYDEQPESYSLLHTQHVRWVWGFIQARDKRKTKGLIYNKKHLKRFHLARAELTNSLTAFATYEVVVSLVMLSSIALFIASIFQFYGNDLAETVFFNVLRLHPITACGIFMVIAGLLCLILNAVVPLIIFSIDKKNINWRTKTKVKVCFTYYIFNLDFLFAFLDGLFHPKKRKSWKPIAHNGDISNKTAQSITSEINISTLIEDDLNQVEDNNKKSEN